MVKTIYASKRLYQNLSLGILVLYLLLFPFGQLLKMSVVILGREVDVNIIDLVVLFSIVLHFVRRPKLSALEKSIKDFLLICIFSLILSFGFFPVSQVLYGLYYLLRFISYYTFFALVAELIREGCVGRENLLKSLIGVSVFVGVLGWLQYLYFPDLTYLKYLNWDDHLYRLTGTFLDPAFTAVILIFGALISLIWFFEKRKIFFFLLAIFLSITTAFTYNRAGFLAYFAGLAVYFLVIKKKSFLFLTISLVFGVIILLLPQYSSEGTLLDRTVSVFAKLDNYKETLEIIKKYPLFGVGFNNICPARIEIFGGNVNSHACGGADSSLLFVLATTGVIGFLVFVKMCYEIFRNASQTVFGNMFLVLSAVLFVDSLFAQSAFYSFVMGYMGMFYAISVSAAKGNK